MSGHTLLNFILLSLVPCSHKSQSWPMRLSDETGAHRTCLECGKRLRYSLLDPEHGAVAEYAGATSYPQNATAAALLSARSIM
jgi:hypothetical protein